MSCLRFPSAVMKLRTGPKELIKSIVLICLTLLGRESISWQRTDWNPNVSSFACSARTPSNHTSPNIASQIHQLETTYDHHEPVCSTIHRSKLRPGEQLYSDVDGGHFICSPNGKTWFGYDDVGDLSLWRDRRKVWSAKTAGMDTYATMQSDGNLVVYRSDSSGGADMVVWASNTAEKPGSFLSIEDGGNARIWFEESMIWSAVQTKCIAEYQARSQVPFDIVTASCCGLSPFPMAVYGDTESVKDIVSDHIRRHGHWEAHNVDLLERQLRSAPRSIFLDVGANIGWFASVMAAKGYETFAVEPFESNRRLIELTACLNPDIKANLHLVPYGLHTNNRTCEMWQIPSTNLGDTHSLCDDMDGDAKKAGMSKAGYEKVGTMKATTLDTLVESGAIDLGTVGQTVMKIDVEGFEPFAMFGGKESLRRGRPRFILSEFTARMLNDHPVATGYDGKLSLAYLNTMADLGYQVYKWKDTKATALDRSGFQTFQGPDVIFATSKIT